MKLHNVDAEMCNFLPDLKKNNKIQPFTCLWKLRNTEDLILPVLCNTDCILHLVYRFVSFLDEEILQDAFLIIL